MNDPTAVLNNHNCSHDPFLKLWAKSNPYKQLLSHMLDTGCCAVQFLSAPSSRSVLQFLMDQWQYDEKETIDFAAYLAAMHDIGKAMPQFQVQDENMAARIRTIETEELFSGNCIERIQHEYYSARIFSRIWKQRKNPKPVYDSYAAVLFLHHQREEKQRGPVIPLEWAGLQNKLESYVRSVFPVHDTLPCPISMDAVCILLSGLIILCDWTASSGPFDGIPEVGKDYISSASTIALHVMRSYGLADNRNRAGKLSFQSLWPHITSLRGIQKCCNQLNPEAPITVIEAPMGEGKTEAALYMAEIMRNTWNKRGIYVALPTQATSNQIFIRTTSMLANIEGGHARLMHGTAFLQIPEKHIQNDDSDNRLEAERWLGSLRMGMLDENGVGTVDQAMAGVLKARFSVLRLLGLTNKVLVVDELHAYDAYMSEIIQSLLKWCRVLRIPVILLSATLQHSQRKAYLSCFTEDPLEELSSAYPLITQIDSAGHLSQTSTLASIETVYNFDPVRLGEDFTVIAGYAVERVKKAGCFCILMNTVKKAQHVYQALRDLAGSDTETMLFHARFPMGRRAEIEKECIRRFGNGPDVKRPRKMILVATQVVEQSLDLDFDGMLTELAPIDLLLQRAGRVHRHRGRTRPSGLEKPVIHVILPDESAKSDPEIRYGSTGYIYAPFLLLNTEHMTENGKQVCVPGDVRKVIEQVYAQVTPESMKVWYERDFSQQLERANALGNTFPEPEEDFFFPTQSHPEFSDLSIDDGFEPALRATTRLGEPTFRVAFSTPALAEAAKSGQISRDQLKEIFLSSVSLSMKQVSSADLESSSLVKIQKGVLRGCFISGQCDIIRIGEKYLVNDPVLGVLWKE